MKFQTLLNEYGTLPTEKLPEGERLPSPEEVSEMITDADSKGSLLPEEQEAIEDELNKEAINIYKKMGNSAVARKRFIKVANKALSAYGIKLK